MFRRIHYFGLAALLAWQTVPLNSSEPGIQWIDELGGRYTLNESGNVASVDLRNTWVTDGDLAKLATWPDLESINLAYTKITDVGLESLAPLPNVKQLDLDYAENVTDHGIAHLKHWTKLEYLNARGTKVTSTLFEHLSQMTSLRSLDVSHSRVNDDLFEALAGLDRLEHFAFGGNKMSGAALPLLKLLPALRELNVGGQQRTDSGLWSVAVTDFNVDNITQLDQLQVLDLSETRISDRGLAELTALKKLHTLNLRQTRITSKGIAALTQLPDLRHLKLWRAEGIDDAAIDHLLAMEKLAILELAETSVTAAGLTRLAQNEKLEQLLIGGIQLTADELAALRAARPACQVSWWEKPQLEEPRRRGRRGD